MRIRRRLRRLLAVCAALATSAAFASGEHVTLLDGGGGRATREHPQHLTEEQRSRILAAIDASVQRLLIEGRIAAPTGERVLLGWPLRAANGLDDHGYHGISGYVDQDPAFPGFLLDWNCGDRTYDLSNGYNHSGVDIFTWPDPWNKMDGDQVEIVAAAPGTIVYREGGQYDRSCGFNNNPWNAVYVRHADGAIAWYGHMKQRSLTRKQIGATVVEGERLGVVGSSGSSTGPHLHLELYDDQGNLVDPYEGPCNALNAEGRWQEQEAYREPQILKLTTGWGTPDAVPPCPNNEDSKEQNVFERGDTVVFTAYYRDQLVNQAALNRIYWPNGTLHTTWTTLSDQNYSASYWWRFFSNFGGGLPIGVWRYEVTFEGETYTHYFAMGTDAAAGAVSALTVDRDPAGDVTLGWQPSCSAMDVDYEVYEGEIGRWYSHDSRLCSTGGLTGATLSPAPWPTYYLVVPTNRVREGSYGGDGNLAERPAGLSPCLPQVVDNTCM